MSRLDIIRQRAAENEASQRNRQYRQTSDDKTVFDTRQTFNKTVTVNVRIEMTTNDIFNWLNACNDVDTLRYLSKVARKRADAIENPDNDDFRSII